LLSFFNLGAVSNLVNEQNNSFGIIETHMRNISEFQENGVKLQYKTKENTEIEISKIKKQLNCNIDGDYREINKNQFQVVTDDIHIDIKTWGENKYNYFEIKLINKNPKYKTLNLKEMLKKIQDEKLEDTQYFLYYKGKSTRDDRNYYMDKLLNENNIQKASLLEINNGYAGTGNLSNGDRVNFALLSMILVQI
jgi:hypothetical protein